jgi:hypothetical protein
MTVSCFLSNDRRPSLRYNLHLDAAIPDYPPPSFQEAIATPVTTVFTAPRNPEAFTGKGTCSPPTLFGYARARTPERFRVTPSATESLAVNLSGSDSENEDSSIEVPEPDRSLTRWEVDRALGLTLEQRVKREWQRKQDNPTPSISSRDNSQTASEFEVRGRTGRGVLESDSEEEAEVDADAMSVAAPSSRRYPRAFPPSKHAQERTLSASPSSSNRSVNQFLKSSTSLYRHPMSNSAPSIRGEGLSKFFSSKGKDCSPIEALDSWEVVDSDVPSSPMAAQSKSTAKFHFPSPQRFLERDARHRPLSPFTGSPDHTTPPTSPKGQKPTISFLNRPVRLPILCSPSSRITPFSSTPSPTAVSANSIAPGRPAIPSLRIPDPSLNSSRNKRKGRGLLSPFSKDREGFTASSPVGSASMFPYERVPNTSQPSTPSDLYPDNTTPVAIHPFGDRSLFKSDIVGASTPKPSKANIQKLLSEQANTPLGVTPSYMDIVEPNVSHQSPYMTKPTMSKFALSASMRHHYPGRPLPFPPPTPARGCPEGLLIDLSDDGTEGDDPRNIIQPNVTSRSAGGSVDDTDHYLDAPISNEVQTPHFQAPVFPLPKDAPPRVRWI